jgi:GntR family transcriptional regulator / MocR family aminotransferase
MVSLDRRTSVPLQRQIYASIRKTILEGRLVPGTRLPPTRVLADDLGVSRTTVVLVYEHLETEGYVTSRGSAGTFVAEVRIKRPMDRRIARRSAEICLPSPAQRTVSLARSAHGLSNIRLAPTPFRIGEPATDLFPTRLWSRLYARRLRRTGASLLGYGDAAGYRPLRAAIAAYVGAARGVNATPDQVILTRGTQQAIDIAARLLIAPGDAAWVEDPGYLAARALISIAGARVVPVPIDDEGILVAEGVRIAPGARLAYVSPSHSFPLGATMSLSRRLSLLEWAGRSGAWILEDDFDSEFRYAGAPIASLQGLDTMDRVIYIGTFSKTMFPALRLGYLIAPPTLVGMFRDAHAAFDHFAPNVEQATLAEFIARGHFTAHVRRMRGEYAARQRALLRSVSRDLNDLIVAKPADTGMHIVAWLRDTTIDDALVSRLASEAGVEAAALSMYAAAAKLPPALLLGFAGTRPGEMRGALRTIRDAIRGAMKKR